MRQLLHIALLFAAAMLFHPSHDFAAPIRHDWLLNPAGFTTRTEYDSRQNLLMLSNGLIRRTFKLTPNAATTDYTNLMTGDPLIRAIRPEAILQIDGATYKVGGLEGQIDQAYLLQQWLPQMRADSMAFHCTGFETGSVVARFPYHRTRWGMESRWPPPGKSLTLHFTHHSHALQNVFVNIHYEMYDGIPLLSKWLTIDNKSSRPVRVNTFISEVLAVIEPEVSVDAVDQWERPNFHVESDYSFHGMMPKGANRTTFLVPDSSFTSQVNYELKTPCVIESKPPIGPDLVLEKGSSFQTFRTFELAYDSYDRERKGLALRRMYRTIAPWVTENPIFMHLTTCDSAAVREAVDQCVAVGFEMIILSFGSGLDMESNNAAYLDHIKRMVDYAHSKGIQMGGYSLLASRRISDEEDVIDPKTGKTGHAIFGNSPCLGSNWGISYFRTLRNFLDRTDFDVLEHDGSYPGDLCAATTHPGHRGLLDSQWSQWHAIADFYQWCRAKNIYLNVPDWYFLQGSNKTGIGYRETNWSLPRDRQIMLGRQNIFDGTWEKTPSMGWTFVPLVQYQGGGELATLEPLSKHLDAYKAHLAQNFGAGVQACYRGPRLFDTDSTRNLVRQWVDWYKRYRVILNSDIIHIRRPDGHDLDGFLHVNPANKQRGLLMLFNPTGRDVREILPIPLYYTGLTDTARVRQGEGQVMIFRLQRDYSINLPVELPAGGVSWYVIE